LADEVASRSERLALKERNERMSMFRDQLAQKRLNEEAKVEIEEKELQLKLLQLDQERARDRKYALRSFLNNGWLVE
jgi:cell division protein FtsI/penicillin-binding protein 2